MGACIHAHISHTQHYSVKFARGEGSQDNKQVCVAIYQVNFCIEQKFGKLIVVFDFIEWTITHLSFWLQIQFKSRKKGDVRNGCLLLVDGTNFRVGMGYSKPFWSYKFKKSGLRYEVGLCILTGVICWWSGPYALGKWNDLSIFRDSLVSMLEPGERCETDRGYQGATPAYVKCAGVVEANPNTAQI